MASAIWTEALMIYELYPENDNDEKDVADMTDEELESARLEMEELIARMEELEPEDTLSDEYNDWADEMENMEDLLDDITDEAERRKRKKK